MKSSFPLRVFPVLTVGFILINLVAYWFNTGHAWYETSWVATTAYGLLPADASVSSAVTAMFMHGGFGHIFGNMVVFLIFGWAVEDDLGPWVFLAFYLLTGFAADAAHLMLSVGEEGKMRPLVGASGAVMGVVGGYLVLIPAARVQSFQKNGCLAIGLSAIAGFMALKLIWADIRAVMNPVPGAAVAHWAHIGGFGSGALLGLILRPRLRTHREVSAIVVLPKRKYTGEMGEEEEEQEGATEPQEEETPVWVNWEAVGRALGEGMFPPRVAELARDENREELIPLLQRMLGHMLRQEKDDRVKEIQSVLKLLGVRL